MSSELNCSFCQKSEHQVEKLVAGPGVYICDACVEIASRIMQDAGRPTPKEGLWRRLAARLRGVIEALRHRMLFGQAAGHAA
jgi:ATP-dependent protease Clp ATPase subunit